MYLGFSRTLTTRVLRVACLALASASACADSAASPPGKGDTSTANSASSFGPAAQANAEAEAEAEATKCHSHCMTSMTSKAGAGASGGRPAAAAGSGGNKPHPPRSDDEADAGRERDSEPDAATSGRRDIEAAFFSTVELEEGTSLPQLGMGDLWPSCWSRDDVLYVAGGDGTGFGILSTDVFVAGIEGSPGAAGYRGTQYASGAAVSDVWSGSDYNRKPTGMLCVDGSLYLAVQDLRVQTFDDAPAATIARSDDKGRSWSWDRKAPMFASNVFTTVMFLDYGKDSEHAPPDFVYAYGLDGNWAFSEHSDGPTQMFLARMPRDRIQDRASWEFWSGFDAAGQPHFEKDIAAKKPVLEDTRRLYSKPLESDLRFKNMTVINQGGVVYDAPLQRYLYASWSEYTFELYEAPAPWGPFRLFLSKDFGVWPWNDAKNGGYATTIPSKFISADGKDMLLQANCWGDVTGKNNYKFSLRKLHVEPYAPSQADNEKGPENLATAEHAAVRVLRGARSGNGAVMNDGRTDGSAEDSYTGEAKEEDFWGYTWPKSLHINTLRYTTGNQAANGGAFESLSVQVRRGSSWVDAPIESISPEYPGADAPAFTTYTLRLETVETDGIRIYGEPLGSEHFTSIAELSVHFE